MTDPHPFGALGLRRKAERDAAGLDALLGAADALRDRRLRNEECARNLGGREPSHGPERERELRGRGQGGMGAQEEEGQRVILAGTKLLRSGSRLGALVERHLNRRPFLMPPSGLIAAQLIGEPASGDGDQPASRVVGDALIGPLERAAASSASCTASSDRSKLP